MGELALLFSCLFILDMIRIIYGRYKNDWTEVRNVQLMENMPSYKRVIECLQKRNTQGNEGGYLDGGLKQIGLDVNDVNLDEVNIDITQDQLSKDLEALQKIEELDKAN